MTTENLIFIQNFRIDAANMVRAQKPNTEALLSIGGGLDGLSVARIKLKRDSCIRFEYLM